MSKGRIVAAIAALALVIVIAFVWWRTHGNRSPAAVASSSAKVSVARTSKDPTTGVPRWLGQAGIGGRRIAGIVVGEDGAPVAGANVNIASTYTIAGLVPAGSKVTDATGRFDFGLQPAAAYVVSAERPKLTGALVPVDLRDPVANPPSDQLRLVLHRCDASIIGTIYDSAGGPIGGAVIARMYGLVTKTGVAADDAGNYELCVPAGGAWVAVSADGYAPVIDSVTVYGRTRRDFRLVPGAPIVGRVVRAADKSPVEGAIVQLSAPDFRSGQMPQTTASDQDGRFHFDAAAPGRHSITAYAERLATDEPVDASADVGAPPVDVVCELVDAVNVSGRVVERGTSKPVSGHTVYLASGKRSARDFTGPLSGRSQADGSFVVERVLAGDYQAITDRFNRDHEIPMVKVESADVTGLVLEVDATATIAGRVLHEGKPIDGALVRADEASTTSDAAGHYELRNVKAGTHKLYAQSHLVGAFTPGPSVTVAGGDAKTGVDIEMDLAGSIAGIVVDQHDAPVGGVFLSFSLLHGRDFGNATTADDGTFTARALSGGGDYVYEVRQRDGSAIIFPPASGKRFAPITVSDGGTHVTGVRVQIEYERLAISGRITDAAGKPIVDASVSALPTDERWFRVPSTTSDQNGGFTIRDLPAGVYAVQATTSRGEARQDGVAAGRSDVVLRMLEPGGVDGTLVGFSGKPEVLAYRIDDRSSTRYRAVVTGATFTLRNLPEGRYRISVTAGADTSSVTVPVIAGTIRTVNLGATEVGILTGTVVDDKTHAPAAGVHCISTIQRGDAPDYESPRPEVTTDAKGEFRIERAPAGDVLVSCYGPTSRAIAQATVTIGQVTHVDLALRTPPKTPDRAQTIGLTLEEQLGAVYVGSVAPGGPAARAGIQVNDVIVSVDGKPIGRYQSDLAMRMMEVRRDSGSTAVVLERNDKQLTVQLKLDPPPAP